MGLQDLDSVQTAESLDVSHAQVFEFLTEEIKEEHFILKSTETSFFYYEHMKSLCRTH